MKNKYIVILFVIISLLFASKNFFSSSDEKLIRKNLSFIEDVGSFSQLLKPIKVVGRLKSLEKFFTKDVVIKVFNFDNKFHESKGFEDAKAALFLGSKLISSNKLIRTQTDIEIKNDKAEVSYLVLAKGQDKSSSNYRELFSVLAKLEKKEKNWLFSEVNIDRITEENIANE